MDKFNQSLLNQTLCYSPLPAAERISRHERTTLIILHTIITPITLLFNGFLIYAITKTADYKRQFPRYILALSTSDTCAALFIQPLLISHYVLINQGIVNCTLSWCIALLSYCLLNLTPILTLVIAVDRFIRMKGCIVENRTGSKDRVNLFIMASICLSVVIPIGTAIAVKTGTFCYYQISLISVNILTGFAVVNFYVKTWWNVRKITGNFGSFNYTKSKGLAKLNRAKLSQRPKHDQTMTRTITAILVCLLVFYLPYLIVSFIRTLRSLVYEDCMTYSTFYLSQFFFTFFLIFINSFLNSFLYSCNNKKVKSLLWSILLKQYGSSRCAASDS